VKKISGQQLLIQKKPKSLDYKFKIKNQRRIREIQIPEERVLTRRGSIAMNDGERWRHDEEFLGSTNSRTMGKMILGF
jgi:hypothetical protein